MVFESSVLPLLDTAVTFRPIYAICPIEFPNRKKKPVNLIGSGQRGLLPIHVPDRIHYSERNSC